MTNIKASTRFDEPVTQESLGQAIVKGAQTNSHWRSCHSCAVRATVWGVVVQF
jgi:hypothetical protein